MLQTINSSNSKNRKHWVKSENPLNSIRKRIYLL